MYAKEIKEEELVGKYVIYWPKTDSLEKMKHFWVKHNHTGVITRVDTKYITIVRKWGKGIDSEWTGLRERLLIINNPVEKLQFIKELTGQKDG